jgi:serine/threonine protein kinase
MERRRSQRNRAQAAASKALATVSPTETIQTPIEAPPPPPEPRVVRPEVSPPGLPTVGDILGTYELVGLLGRGTTSIVYRGQHRKLLIPVAVKVLHPDELANSPGLIGQLVSEAVLLAKLNHPNIVRLWDLDDEGPAPYLVLEYVAGTTLGELIVQQGRVPIPFAFAIIRQAVEGLAEAHKLGVVHRDVKPGNLLLGIDGVVKVADLGLAMVVGDRLTRQAADGRSAGMPAGTAAYLAPEQACDPSKVDFRADIYSLGATLYHALTNHFPFEGRTSLQLIFNAMREPLLPPRHYLPELTEEQSDLVVKMLSKDPADRFSSYDELRAALARAVGDRRAPLPLAEAFLAWATPHDRDGGATPMGPIVVPQAMAG